MSEATRHPRLDTPIVKDWLAALRSGTYGQCKKTLWTPDGGHCCVGVLAKVARLHGIPAATKDTSAGSWFRGSPGVFRESVGLRTYAPLVCLNDDGVSFAGIADYIETHADELFLPLEEARP